MDSASLVIQTEVFNCTIYGYAEKQILVWASRMKKENWG